MTPTVTPPERQRVATVTHIRPVAYADGEVVQIRRPQAPTYDAQVLRDGLEAAKQTVRDLQYHLTEAEINPGQRPTDPRAQQTRNRALALARAVQLLRKQF